NKLANVTSELASTRTELTSTKGELASTRTELTSTKGELASTKNQLTSAQQATANLQATLSSTQQQLTIYRETLTGLGITLQASNTCYDVHLIDNPEADDPTFDQLITFLSQDKTENNSYIANVYDCSQFSRDIHNNAEAKGIRTAEVHARFENDTIGHALNAFLTTDYGLVYVDCTEAPDKIARVKTGKDLRSIELAYITKANIRNDSWWDSLARYYYMPSSTNEHCVTSKITIFW
ncbi:MAG: hypothetical protein PHR43_07025, partial [Dehalococcoidales bacterium]|nr:hypothetical protein [Dehalococcoidales bacterium]